MSLLCSSLCKVNTRDERFAGIALREADKSNMYHHKHGCVAVMNGQIVARGYNSTRTQSSDGFLKNTCSCHAEIDVMRKLEKSLNRKSSSSFRAKKRRSCFLWKNKPLRCKKKFL
jgi:tRNA(Arg) A34 adenosine deaminase TadA